MQPKVENVLPTGSTRLPKVVVEPRRCTVTRKGKTTTTTTTFLSFLYIVKYQVAGIVCMYTILTIYLYNPNETWSASQDMTQINEPMSTGLSPLSSVALYCNRLAALAQQVPPV